MAMVAITAPSNSISKIAGNATCVMRWPSNGDAVTKLEAISSAMDDRGDIDRPTHIACFQLAPLPGLAMATPAILATARTAISASTRPATGRLQSACAATRDTSTNISMVSSEAAVPSWRGQAQGLGFICLSSTPAIKAPSGADPPRCAVSAAPAAISASSSKAVFSLVGLITRKAERSARARTQPIAIDRPSTTNTGCRRCIRSVGPRSIRPACA